MPRLIFRISRIDGTNGVAFDLTGDGFVDLADRDKWLVLAGAMNLPSGNPYLLADANLDGTVDEQDFGVWTGNKFTVTGKWSQADWNADGVTDGRDLLYWNAHKFQTSDRPRCSVDGDSDCDIEDIDALITEIAAGTNNPLYDLTDDDLVNLADRDRWLEDAGAMNLMSGNPYPLADSNLDGIVNAQDFEAWQLNRFSSTSTWSQADWNADGFTEGRDLLIWNANKTIDPVPAFTPPLPEPLHPVADAQTAVESGSTVTGSSLVTADCTHRLRTC